MTTFLIISGVVMFLALGCKYLSSKKAKKRREERQRRVADELNEFGNQVKSQNGLKPITSDVLLKQEEDAYLETQTSLLETRAIRHYQSGMAGFRIAKGVYVGGSKGRAESTPEWRILDKGKLTLTNKRLIFDGSKENRVMSLEKIISMKPWNDSIEISLENRQKSVLFPVPNPYLWAITMQILAGTPDPKKLKDFSFTTENNEFKIHYKCDDGKKQSE